MSRSVFEKARNGFLLMLTANPLLILAWWASRTALQGHSRMKPEDESVQYTLWGNGSLHGERR